MNDPNFEDDQLDFESQQFVNSLSTSRLSAPENKKAELLYQCGVAATENRFRSIRQKRNWSTAATILLALTIGGIGGRWSMTESPAASSIVDNRERDEPITNSELELPMVHERKTVRQPGTLLAMMSIEDIQLALSNQHVVAEDDDTLQSSDPQMLRGWMAPDDLKAF